MFWVNYLSRLLPIDPEKWVLKHLRNLEKDGYREGAARAGKKGQGPGAEANSSKN